MSETYTVVQGGVTVWEETFPDHTRFDAVPLEYLDPAQVSVETTILWNGVVYSIVPVAS